MKVSNRRKNPEGPSRDLPAGDCFSITKEGSYYVYLEGSKSRPLPLNRQAQTFNIQGNTVSVHPSEALGVVSHNPHGFTGLEFSKGSPVKP